MITTKTQEELWERVLSDLKPELKDETFDLWLKPLKAARFDDGVFVLRVPNRFFSDWIKAHYQTRIEQILSHTADSPVRLAFDIQADDVLPAPASSPMPIARPVTDGRVATPAKHSLFTEDFRLDSKYAFDNFIVGPSNRFAEAAAEAVARDPGRTYNPLFI